MASVVFFLNKPTLISASVSSPVKLQAAFKPSIVYVDKTNTVAASAMRACLAKLSIHGHGTSGSMLSECTGNKDRLWQTHYLCNQTT